MSGKKGKGILEKKKKDELLKIIRGLQEKLDAYEKIQLGKTNSPVQVSKPNDKDNSSKEELPQPPQEPKPAEEMEQDKASEKKKEDEIVEISDDEENSEEEVAAPSPKREYMKVRIHTNDDAKILVSLNRFENFYEDQIRKNKWRSHFLDNVDEQGRDWSFRKLKNTSYTWENWKKDYIKRWATPDYDALLRQKIINSKQGNQTMTEYWIERTNLIDALGLTEQDRKPMIRSVIRGFRNDELKNRIRYETDEEKIFDEIKNFQAEELIDKRAGEPKRFKSKSEQSQEKVPPKKVKCLNKPTKCRNANSISSEIAKKAMCANTNTQ